MAELPTRLSRGVLDAGGRGLSAAFGLVARVRPAAKPLHPRGRLYDAVIQRQGLCEPVGVPFIDEPGTTSALVRVSRALGLPPALPDIHGMAIRLPVDGGRHADILLAATGLGRISRYVLLPGASADHRSYSTLIPYETSGGPLNLAAIPVQGEYRAFDLACAHTQEKWTIFARMRLEESPAQEQVTFDPVLNTLPGLGYYDWAVRLRERAYRAARRSRADD
ncbi:hypothetical protein [Aeromicrobium chenweiae]|uniref:Uncharacterized protein n=1 Tax=Aeromicrobium chenweiae TaxID=2079793 RepID=A0A2S0WKH4_9ACTN|nr:hypothetical protein [Aeromicrobium chenweiae]AWB91849.1 hypothetical protein C3E78_06320 [Aeromicrobium chenweiae]TGN32694.1 hypothetical protein E4L97_08285 [Aeromicrobium chenweiae]